jgi:hypothetical protein
MVQAAIARCKPDGAVWFLRGQESRAGANRRTRRSGRRGQYQGNFAAVSSASERHTAVPRTASAFTFGPDFLTWLEGQITVRGLCFVVLDSYTALRGPRLASTDIVKAEQSDLTLLDGLAKKTGCAIVLIHHASKGSASLDWSEKAAGTFAMSAATEAQIPVARFPELDGAG